MFDSNQFFGGAAGFYPVSIEQSLRLNDDDSAYLSRTPASAGNRKTWTWSGWVKRGNLDINYPILFFCYANSINYFFVRFLNTNEIQILDKNAGTNNLVLTTNSVYRDPSAWYHIVLSVDTTQATSSNRAKLYVNGEQVTGFSTATYPSQNFDTYINSANQHNIGASDPLASTQRFDGYMAEVNFIDGTAYDADAFGELKSGVWVAKSPSVTYGTNGFHLDFANSADIGNDVSGEGNDWTPNNFTASDVVSDSPTDNFATLNPLHKNSSVTFSDGNLKLTHSVVGWLGAMSTMGVSSGKWYWEAETTYFNTMLGIGTNASNVTTADAFPGRDADSYGYYGSGGAKFNNSVSAAYGAGYTSGDVIGVAFNADDGEITFYKNGVSQGVAYTGIPDGTYFPWCSLFASGSQSVTANFGQQPFTYTPPTDYLALSTANLPDPVIDPAQGSSPEDYFAPVIYSGDSTSSRSITTGLQSDFVWIKRRNSATSHILFDVIRGAGKTLYSHLTNAEVDNGGYYVQSFDSDGFTLGTGGDAADNQTGGTYVAWNWKANGSGVSNTDGSITSTVSANTESGFSIVSYTGDGTTGATVGHGLNSSADVIILKDRDVGTNNWRVWHKDLTTNYWIYLNLTNAEVSAATDGGIRNVDADTFGFINGTTAGVEAVNRSSGGFIAYCFHSVEGFSKFGSYTGNGSSDGVFVYTGFRPAFVMIKRTTANNNWIMWDNNRSPSNLVNDWLYANLSDAEAVGDGCDFLSNGFKLRQTANAVNGSGDSYIFMAFAENPFKYSNAR